MQLVINYTKSSLKMVLVKIEKEPGTDLENIVAKALEKSIAKDLNGIECPFCDKESYVSVQIRKNKLNGMTTHVHACCKSFKEKIEEILLLGQSG